MIIKGFSVLTVLKRPAVAFMLLSLLCAGTLYSQDFSSNEWSHLDYESEYTNIRSVNGKFYAYIVLLFNENPHFVNLIQRDSIPLRVIGKEGFHVRAYKSYMGSVRDRELRSFSELMLKIYLEPGKFTAVQLRAIEKRLIKRNIILRFSRDRSSGISYMTLDYCIFGSRVLLPVRHPLMTMNEPIYNIRPFIYYDEFSTSNSTFYYDMIYINPVEVRNDTAIARKVIAGGNVDSLFFVGSRVTPEIRKSLNMAFKGNLGIQNEIWKMFIIHELTHKILNNKYNNYDQVIGEELSLCSTIYANPYLGLAVMFSYLNYNAINPHRIAAMNYLKYISEKTGDSKILERPVHILEISGPLIKKYSRDLFNANIRLMR